MDERAEVRTEGKGVKGVGEARHRKHREEMSV